jgi:TRAP-type C4-dicarboxylate transport system substrate-binding protein
VPKLPTRAGPIGLALTAVDVWRRLSPRQRRLIVRQAQKYGPRVAEQAARSARTAAASLRARRSGK